MRNIAKASSWSVQRGETALYMVRPRNEARKVPRNEARKVPRRTDITSMPVFCSEMKRLDCRAERLFTTGV